MKKQTNRFVAALALAAVIITGCSRSGPPAAPSAADAPGAEGIRLTDVTGSAGLSFVHSHGGAGAHYYVETMGPGCAFLDYDRDGWLDILLLQGAPLPDFKASRPMHSALYRNNRDGTFTDATQAVGLDREFYGIGVAVADYDNDGWPDLFVTTLDGNRLFHNQGGAAFVDVTERAGVRGRDMSTGAAWLDFNHDGLLDLFVGRYMDYDVKTNPRCQDALGRPAYCAPHVYTPTYSSLYENRGDGTFADVTEASGVGKAVARAMGIACADFNQDGRIDIFVASDLSPNLLFINRGDGTFDERACVAGVAYGDLGVARAGMGVDCGDYDNDGNLDLIVTNFEREPNSVFRNLGRELFQEQSLISGIARASLPFLSWGCRFVDFDRDGRADLFWVSGHVNDYAVESKDALGFNQPAQLLRNLGEGRFADVSQQCGEFFARRQVARGAAFGDFDNDGNIDVLIGCNNQPAVLLRNDTKTRHGWVRLELMGQGCNRDALGALVRLTAGSMPQCQVVRSAGSYLSDHDRRLLFGIGTAPDAQVAIQWPCGATQTLNICANTALVVREAECRLGGRN